MHNQIASFRAALDARRVSRYQWLILLLLALLLVTDGYDAQVLGYVVPALASGFGLGKSPRSAPCSAPTCWASHWARCW